MDFVTLAAARSIAQKLIEQAAINTGDIDLTSYAKKIDLNAYTKKNDLTPYAKKNDLTSYAKKDDLDSYAEKDDLDSYAKKNDLDSYAEKTDLASYAEKIDLASYAKKTDLDKLTENQLNTTNEMNNEINNKISKDGDKILTDINFTKEYEAKLKSLENFSKQYKDLIGTPDIPNLEGYATEEYVLNSLKDINVNDIDLSAYEKIVDANNKLLTKAEKNHTHNMSEINNLSDTLLNYYSKTESLSKEEITEMIAAIAKGINWKEPVDTSDNLPKEDNTTGDARIIIDSNAIAVWNGTEWIQTGSASVTNLASDTLDGLMSMKDKTKLESINVDNLATKEDLNSKANSEHIHVRYVEKENGKSLVPDIKIAKWDAKADNADIPVNISQLKNDKLYINKEALLNELSKYTTQDSINSLLVNYIKREEISSMLIKNNIVAGENISLNYEGNNIIINSTSTSTSTSTSNSITITDDDVIDIINFLWSGANPEDNLDNVISKSNICKILKNNNTMILDKETYASKNNKGAVKYADNLTEASHAKPLQYYGTDNDNNLGMHYFPINTKDNTGLEQRVCLDAKANEDIVIDSVLDISNNKVLIQCYKFVEGEDNAISTVKTFNNTEKDNFYYDKDNIKFSDSMHFKKEHEINSRKNPKGYYETDIIDKNLLFELINIEEGGIV